VNPNQYLPIVRRAISEELGLAGDLTSDAIAVPAAVSGTIVARGAGTVAGQEVAAAAFTEIDHATVYDELVKDGTKITRGTKLARVQGTARSLLTAERLALNVLGMMSGVATATAQLVDLVKGTGARISDTRKTSPGLRVLEKYAVTVGGGINRRFGLHDAVMIKDNHLIISMSAPTSCFSPTWIWPLSARPSNSSTGASWWKPRVESRPRRSGRWLRPGWM
jgi:nicotinate-nucleotide pyrophosphorylase (carboxylating)